MTSEREKHIERSCTGKLRFEREWQARREAKRSGMEAYQCRYCKGFHVGHS